MLKKILLTALLAGFALSANAQIATPSLNAGFHTYGGAAAGWRYGSTVNLVGLSLDGKIDYNGTEIGDVTVGMNAKGPEDSASPIPFLSAAYRGEQFAGELYTNLSDGLKSDAEIEPAIGVTSSQNSEQKEMRVNLAYVLGEVLSIGIGYSSLSDKAKETTSMGGAAVEANKKSSTIGTSVSASYRLADIFFLAAGMESVKQTGNFSCTESPAGSIGQCPAASYEADYVDNSWTEMMYGVGLITGNPGDTQFRVEYSMISSPESEKKADGSKLGWTHYETNKTFVTVEAKFGDFLVGYQNETEKVTGTNNAESEDVTTSAGLGWEPMEGLTVSLYSIENKMTDKDSSGETTVNPKGYQFLIGYNF